MLFQELDIIYALTCPSIIHSPVHGHIGLHRNTQFIDPETIVECDLHHFNDGMQSDVLNPGKSIITARDFVGDGNTFKTMDHLIAGPNAFEHIQRRGMLRDDVCLKIMF